MSSASILNSFIRLLLFLYAWQLGHYKRGIYFSSLSYGEKSEENGRSATLLSVPSLTYALLGLHSGPISTRSVDFLFTHPESNDLSAFLLIDDLYLELGCQQGHDDLRLLFVTSFLPHMRLHNKYVCCVTSRLNRAAYINIIHKRLSFSQKNKKLDIQRFVRPQSG